MSEPDRRPSHDKTRLPLPPALCRHVGRRVAMALGTPIDVVTATRLVPSRSVKAAASSGNATWLQRLLCGGFGAGYRCQNEPGVLGKALVWSVGSGSVEAVRCVTAALVTAGKTPRWPPPTGAIPCVDGGLDEDWDTRILAAATCGVGSCAASEPDGAATGVDNRATRMTSRIPAVLAPMTTSKHSRMMVLRMFCGMSLRHQAVPVHRLHLLPRGSRFPPGVGVDGRRLSTSEGGSECAGESEGGSEGTGESEDTNKDAPCPVAYAPAWRHVWLVGPSAAEFTAAAEGGGVVVQPGREAPSDTSPLARHQQLRHDLQLILRVERPSGTTFDRCYIDTAGVPTKLRTRALAAAVEGGHTAIVRHLLLEVPAWLGFRAVMDRSPNAHRSTPVLARHSVLCHAARHGRLDIVRLLCECDGDEMGVRACCRPHDATPDGRDPREYDMGWLAAIEAVHTGQLHIVRYLAGPPMRVRLNQPRAVRHQTCIHGPVRAAAGVRGDGGQAVLEYLLSLPPHRTGLDATVIQQAALVAATAGHTEGVRLLADAALRLGVSAVSWQACRLGVKRGEAALVGHLCRTATFGDLETLLGRDFLHRACVAGILSPLEAIGRVRRPAGVDAEAVRLKVALRIRRLLCRLLVQSPECHGAIRAILRLPANRRPSLKSLRNLAAAVAPQADTHTATPPAGGRGCHGGVPASGEQLELSRARREGVELFLAAVAALDHDADLTGKASR